jgi:hypothetical protein
MEVKAALTSKRSTCHSRQFMAPSVTAHVCLCESWKSKFNLRKAFLKLILFPPELYVIKEPE